MHRRSANASLVEMHEKIRELLDKQVFADIEYWPGVHASPQNPSKKVYME